VAATIAAAAAAGPQQLPQRLELLKGLSGFLRPNDLLCLMGGSGAGKTTLMDVLAGRWVGGRWGLA